MDEQTKSLVEINGYGVIGKRVADAVAAQDDMEPAGVADVTADWRPRMAIQKGFPLCASAEDRLAPMREAGLDLAGMRDDLLGDVDVIVECTPKRVGRKNVETRANPDFQNPPFRDGERSATVRKKLVLAHRQVCQPREDARLVEPLRRDHSAQGGGVTSGGI